MSTEPTKDAPRHTGEQLSREELMAALRHHDGPEIVLSGLHVCRGCRGQWVCVGARALTMALALLDLRARIENTKKAVVALADRSPTYDATLNLSDVERLLLALLTAEVGQ